MARKIAQQFGPPDFVSRINFVQRDGYRLNGLDQQFDAIFCMNNLLFAQDYLPGRRLESIAQRFHAVLRPKGHLVLSKTDIWAQLERTEKSWGLVASAGFDGDILDPKVRFVRVAMCTDYSVPVIPETSFQGLLPFSRLGW